MRRCLLRVLSVLVAFALVMNGVPAVASAISASVGQELSALYTQAASSDDMPMDDCCNDCMPTGGQDRACVALCVQLPALPTAAGPLVQVGRAPVFEPMALMTVRGRLIAPDPLPPRLPI